MHPHPMTTTAFLDALRTPGDAAAWEEFDRRYRPIVFGFARHLGLSEQDAADAAQETILAFLRQFGAGDYSRERGRLRSWLLSMARTRVAAHKRDRSKRGTVGAEALEGMPAKWATMSSVWDNRRRREMLRQAMEELRRTSRADPDTLRAFELLHVQRLPPETVAQELQLPVRDVYMAKFRVGRRLRAIVQRLERSYPL